MGSVHTWEHNNFIFQLYIGEERCRFNSEGIYQIINIRVNNVELISSSWGRYHFYKNIEKQIKFWNKNKNDIMDFADLSIFTKDVYYFKLTEFDEYNKIMGDDYIKFNNWLLCYLSPINHGRNLKIQKILKKNVISKIYN